MDSVIQLWSAIGAPPRGQCPRLTSPVVYWPDPSGFLTFVPHSGPMAHADFDFLPKFLFYRPVSPRALTGTGMNHPLWHWQLILQSRRSAKWKTLHHQQAKKQRQRSRSPRIGEWREKEVFPGDNIRNIMDKGRRDRTDEGNQCLSPTTMANPRSVRKWFPFSEYKYCLRRYPHELSHKIVGLEFLGSC